VNESFLEDTNNMLNSGEVPGMYTPEEKDKVCSDIRDWVIQKGGNPTKVRVGTQMWETIREVVTVEIPGKQQRRNGVWA